MKADAAPAKTTVVQSLCLRLFRPVDNSFLIFFRIVFGAIMLWEVCRYLSRDWISRYFIEPIILFTYYGFSWVKPWPGRGMYVHFYVLGALATCILVGLFYRIAATLFFLGFAYVFLLDQTRYLNHFYLIVLISLIMIVVPANSALSVDALLHPRIRSKTAPAWALWLLRVQIGIAYVFGGIAKLNSDWLRGEPMRSWLRPYVVLPLFGPLFGKEWVVYSFVIGGLALDLFVVPLLLWRRTRPYAFVAAVVFNLINSLLFQIGIFPWFMLGATLLFFPPDTVRRIVRWIIRAFDTPESLPDGSVIELPAPQTNDPETVPNSSKFSTISECGPLPRRKKAFAAVLLVYLALQLLLPIRHFAYPGNVSWTEEGHNFSWHMKLRTKRAEAVFTITHPASGQTWVIDPSKHLEAQQLTKMATHPDMALQYSHFLAEQKRREGFENVEVRAYILASLNGRKPQLLIDPTVDLAKEQASLLPAKWILPLTEPPPARGSGAKEIDDPDQE